MPNPLRAIAKGKPVYTLSSMVFIDDVSGNDSKQWNEHIVCYTSNTSLPREELDKQSNVRFFAASPHAKPLEIAEGLKKSMQ